MDVKPELIHVEIPRSAICVDVPLKNGRINRPEGHTPHTTFSRPGSPVRRKHCHRRLEWDAEYGIYVSMYRIREEEEPWNC